MGTDIHGRLQFRYSKDSPYQDGGAIEDGRNYRVFAMLAGVRNGFGFAGVETHVPLEPISEPRGLPEHLGIKDTNYETSPITTTYFSEDEFGDHSFSWVTLSELINWPGWTMTLERRGIVEAAEWARMQAAGDNVPQAWCGGITGRDVVIVTPEQAQAGAKYTHVEYRWGEPFAHACPTFKAWVDYLKLKYSWLLESDPAAVRLVFGFDS